MPYDHPTVLVAIRDPELRNALVQSLRHDDCLVLEAASSTDAFHLVRTHSRPIHVMVIDESMKTELKTAVEQHRPQTRILLFAGYGNEGGQDVLTPETALDKIRQVLKA